MPCVAAAAAAASAWVDMMSQDIGTVVKECAHLGPQALRVWSCSYLREMRLDALDRFVVAAPSPRPAFKDLQQTLLIGVKGKG